MKITDPQLEKLLASASAPALKSALVSRRLVPSLAQAAKLQQHLDGLDAGRRTLRLGVIHTYTSELLDPWLQFAAGLNGLALDIHHAPHGVTLQEARPGSALVEHAPDITLLMLRREDLHPAFRLPASCIPAAERPEVGSGLLGAIEQLLGAFRDQLGGQLILTLLPEPLGPALGLYDAMAAQSETRWWQSLKGELASHLRETFSGVTLLDLDQVMLETGREDFIDARLWYSSMFPFTPRACFALSCAIADLATSLYSTKAKVIAVDADNTLWGGVIGEDGMNGIALGPEYPGNVFVDFQKRLLALQQRGFILALCSKNNPEDLHEVLADHPHQVLRREHFAAERVNWEPKPANLRALAAELNLGLDAFVFIDDSDHECHAVREALPEVEVVQVPGRATEIPGCLDSIARLQVTTLTDEDLAKTAMYAQERERRSQLAATQSGGGNVDDYLLSLGMRMTVGLDDHSLLPRLAQLTQKTNQFNLTTRRYSEQDMAAMLDSPTTRVYHFSLADSFGDSGVVGLAIVETGDDADARLDTFLMSCRVIGRRAEEAFIRRIAQDLRATGVARLAAEYIPTRKNKPVETFLPDNAFSENDGHGWMARLDDAALEVPAGFPISIQGPGDA